MAAKEHGLLFMGDMARAMVLGQKQVTRRIIAPHNSLIDGHGMRSWERYGTPLWDEAWVDAGPSPAGNVGPYLHLPFSDGTTHRIYPRISVGDTIWGKEKWKPENDPELWMCVEYADGKRMKPDIHDESRGFVFEQQCAAAERGERNPWRSSMFMPRWASRIEREVAAICCQRADELDEEEIRQEGILRHTKDGQLWKYGVESWPWVNWELTAQGAWQKLWELANGHESWLARPWVWGYVMKNKGEKA